MLRILIVSSLLFQLLSAQDSLNYQIKTITIKEHSPVYELDYAYPQLEGLRNLQAQARVNTRIDSTITDWVETFRGLSTDVAGGDTISKRTSSEGIGFNVDLANNRIFSISIGANSYVSGGAHPASWSETMVFDLSTGENINLEDLFDPVSHYLDTLSAYCQADIQEDFNLKRYEPLEGLLPNPDNFRNFTLSDRELQILFPEGQILPRAFKPGGFNVWISYSRLRNVLKKGGPIDSLLK